MYNSGIELPQVEFSTIAKSLIPISSYFVGFDLGNLGKLSKMDNSGTITVIESSDTVTSVLGNSPIVSSGGITPTISIPQATGSIPGYLSSADWQIFNNKQDSLIAGTAISIVGSILTNTAPDQIVGLTAGTGISTSGTYPNFTIINTAPDQTIVLTAGTGISTSGTYPNFTITNTLASSGGTVTSVAELTLGTSGTDLSSTVVNGTTTPVITLNVPTASATNRGALSDKDWVAFNGKQDTISLTTTGTGAATLIGTTLNIPTPSSGGGISGSGIADYTARWTPDGTTLGIGAIQDDGTRLGIGVNPASGGGSYKVFISTTDDSAGLTSRQNTTSGTNSKVAIQAICTGPGGSGINIGFNSVASGSTTQNIGISAGSASSGSASSIGGNFSAGGGITNYALQLSDGTEGIGKVLTCMTSDGKANWVTPTSGGTSFSWVSVINPGAGSNTATVANTGYMVKGFNGSSSRITLPVGVVAVGSEVKIVTYSANGNWFLYNGNSSDVLQWDLSMGGGTPGGSYGTHSGNTTGLFFDQDQASAVAYGNARNLSISMVCVANISGTGNRWVITSSTCMAIA